MNEPKRILFNKSTLLSLKAELLKKQEEVHEKKQLPQNKLDNFKPPSSKPTDKGKTDRVKKKSFKDSLQAVDTEELEACRKAKLALEKKAELYEHLSDSAGKSQLAERFLVDFNTKKQQEARPEEKSVTEDDYETSSNYGDEDEWTEFTDCLGRTRKCLKTDLDMYMTRDKELMRVLNKEKPNPDDEKSQLETETKPLLVQKTNEHLQSLREKWEQKERELLAKDKDIHYQDLLFDEARIHGVGYYAFSTDEDERKKQMEELLKVRQETLKAQEEAERTRKKRDELIAARVAAARARQRARAGLPPEEPQEIQKDFNTCLLEFLTQQRNEADSEAREKEQKLKEEKEKERQKQREAFVREWDIGKTGVNNEKGFRVMSQEEYVEQQRDKRINEFAPPNASSSSKSQYSFDETGKINETDDTSSKSNKCWSDVRPKVKTPPPPDISDYVEQKGLYFTTVQKCGVNIKYRNFVQAKEPQFSNPIVNEVDVENGNDIQVLGKRQYQSNSVEIPPPPTYEYYGPVPKQARNEIPFVSNIDEAYAQGAKSLEPKTRTGKKISQNYDFTFE